MKRTSLLLAFALAWLLPLAWTPDARADPTWGRPQPALSSTTIGTTSPLSGGGDLSADLTLSCPTCVTTARTVSTTAPLGGGGALSGDLTLTCSTCVVGPASATDNTIVRYDSTTGKLVQASGVTIDDSDRVGLGTAVPTHSLTLSSTSSGYAAYNTADQTTNYERALGAWSSNLYTISTDAGGSGTQRSLLLRGGTGGGSITLSPFGSMVYGSTGATTATAHTFTHATFTSTSLLQTGLSIGSTVNQASGSGGYTGVLVNPTLTAVGSAGAKLLRLQTASTDRFWVDSAGAIDMDSTVTGAGTTGNQTINKPSGTVNVAAAGTAVTVTNSLVTTNTIMEVVARTNDETCAVKNYVPGAGTVTINMTAACTAETSVGFAILDKN